MYGNKGPEKHTKMNSFQIKITGIAVKKTDTFTMLLKSLSTTLFAVLEVSSDFKIPDIQTINYSVCLVGLIRLLQKSLLKFSTKTIKQEYCLRKC